MKSLLTNGIERFKVALAALLGTLILGSLVRTLRWRTKIIGKQILADYQQRANVLVFWHGHQLMMPWVYYKTLKPSRSKHTYVLISRHADGRIIAKIVENFGLRTVAGSSSRGGERALLKLLDVLKRGHNAVFTPDGPRGPVRKAKPGVLKAAELSGAPIVPMSFAASSYWTFSSWDGMILPKPFARVQAVVGEPFWVAQGEDLEQAAQSLERVLDELERSAAHELGQAAQDSQIPYRYDAAND